MTTSTPILNRSARGRTPMAGATSLIEGYCPGSREWRYSTPWRWISRNSGDLRALTMNPGLVDGIIEPVTGVIPVLLSSGILFVLFSVLWVGFGAGLTWNQGGIDAAWAWIGGLPLVAQAVAWLLFLPVVGALGVWETSWPVLVRLLVVASLAGWSLMIFLPRFVPGVRRGAQAGGIGRDRPTARSTRREPRIQPDAMDQSSAACHPPGRSRAAA